MASPQVEENEKAEEERGPKQSRIVQLPLAGDIWAAIQVPHPMTEDEWEQMMAVLQAMKPGIVLR